MIYMCRLNRSRKAKIKNRIEFYVWGLYYLHFTLKILIISLINNYYVLLKVSKIIMKTFTSLFGFSSQIMKPTILNQKNQMIKLSKYISNQSICSRNEAEKIIELGLVRIDGKRVFQNIMVPEEANLKSIASLGVQKQQHIIKLWMINKPRGYICTHNDPQKRPTVYSLLPRFFEEFGKIHSIGRLDYNSQGLLLLTNNVPLKNLLENPQTNNFRYYRVKVHGRLTQQKLQKMQQTTVINGVQYGPLKVLVDRSLTTNSWLKISLLTGKNRQIRRIMQKNDLQVNKLIRQEYGPYKLGNLMHGEIRELQVSKGLQRKVQQKTAQKLSGGTNCLIEVDIRQKSILYARQELEQKKIQQKSQEQVEQKFSIDQNIKNNIN